MFCPDCKSEMILKGTPTLKFTYAECPVCGQMFCTGVDHPIKVRDRDNASPAFGCFLAVIVSLVLWLVVLVVSAMVIKVFYP